MLLPLSSVILWQNQSHQKSFCCRFPGNSVLFLPCRRTAEEEYSSSDRKAERWRKTWQKHVMLERTKERRESGRQGRVRIPLRFGASQLKSVQQPQNLACSIYLRFACESAAPLFEPNCTFNLSAEKERRDFVARPSPHTLAGLNKPISWTFRLQIRLL